jgi:hypothetical protein
MAKSRGYEGHRKQFLTAARARNVIGGQVPGICGTREKSKTAANASMKTGLKRGSYGVNGTAYYAGNPGSKK